jgi:hypothetical protein
VASIPAPPNAVISDTPLPSFLLLGQAGLVLSVH